MSFRGYEPFGKIGLKITIPQVPSWMTGIFLSVVLQEESCGKFGITLTIPQVPSWMTNFLPILPARLNLAKRHVGAIFREHM